MLDVWNFLHDHVGVRKGTGGHGWKGKKKLTDVMAEQVSLRGLRFQIYFAERDLWGCNLGIIRFIHLAHLSD